jgi:predicted amidohydrolase YtcJ
MKIYRGSIVACDAKNTVARYLVEDGGRIAYVGDALPEKYLGAPVEDLGRRALLPSFADTHNHFLSYATFCERPDLLPARSNEEIMDLMGEYARTCENSIALAFGASAHSVRERRLISRAELDRVSRGKPVMIVKYDGHACIVNQALMNKLDGRVKALRGFNAQTGEMREEAFFAVSDFATHAVSPLEALRNLQRAADMMAARGFGIVHSVSGVGFPGDIDVALECLAARSARGGFQTRVFYQTMDVDKVLKRRLPRVGGCFAAALDGSYGSMDAALTEPYRGTRNRGVLFYSDEAVTEFCKKANRQGLQIEMHAVGDAAFNQAARALKAALDDCPRRDSRHGIIHAFLPTDEGIEICAKYGIQIPLQTAFFGFAQEPDWYLESILGERVYGLMPLRKFLDAGITLTLGSDAPCSKPDPIPWIHNACNHPVASQSVTVSEALRMATHCGYWGAFDERERGSLEAGKIADMAVLSESPYDVPVNELNRIKVEALMLEGKLYVRQRRSVADTLAKGLLGKEKI